MNQFLIPYVPKLIEVCKAHKMSKLYAFGSVVTDRFNDQSDVDLIVEIDQNLDPSGTGRNVVAII